MTRIILNLTNPWWAISALALVALVSTIVFLIRHPVDGEVRIEQAFHRHAFQVAILFGVTAFAITPSLMVLAPVLGICLWVAHYHDEILEMAQLS